MCPCRSAFWWIQRGLIVSRDWTSAVKESLVVLPELAKRDLIHPSQNVPAPDVELVNVKWLDGRRIQAANREVNAWARYWQTSCERSISGRAEATGRGWFMLSVLRLSGD